MQGVLGHALNPRTLASQTRVVPGQTRLRRELSLSSPDPIYKYSPECQSYLIILLPLLSISELNTM